MERAAIDRRKRLNDLWTEVALIAAFQKFFDNTDPVGRKARQLRLRQIKRELHKWARKSVVSSPRKTGVTPDHSWRVIPSRMNLHQPTR